MHFFFSVKNPEERARSMRDQTETRDEAEWKTEAEERLPRGALKPDSLITLKPPQQGKKTKIYGTW